MTTSNVFRSRPEMYAKNVESGEQLRVVPAELSHHSGTTPGVAVFRDRFMLFCLTAEHAWNLNDQLTDALDGLQADRK
ncbi:MAG: hypothetical protein U1D68_10610 [Arthrobacter sp.]|nr:hypothetical protein [Arthrobacter sp.]MDZ4351354.1 hypothetical protein [Arthrobacter sp.]